MIELRSEDGGNHMAEHNILTMEDMKKNSEQILLNEIKSKNHLLFSFIEELLLKNSSQGIREDVFRYLSANAEHIGNKKDELNYEYFISNMALDISMGPEWYEWFDEYFDRENHLDTDDFAYLINESYTERKIPLKDLKDLFNKGQNDVLAILDMIIQYVPDPVIDDMTKAEPDNSSTIEHNQIIVEDAHTSGGTEHYGYVEMFDNLLSVMSYKGTEETSIAGVQNEMNKVLAKFQLATTEMSTLVVEMLKNWEKDKDELKKMKSLYSIQQNLLASQQHTISNLKMDIVKLKNRLSETEKSDLQRISLNNKLLEIQGLMSELSKPMSGDFNG